MTSIEIPSSVTSIGKEAFRGCSNLTSIDIPSGVTSIGSRAFERCSSLISIEIPCSVTSIYGNIIEDCSSLTVIYCEAISEPISGWRPGWNDNKPVVWGYNNITSDSEYDYVVHNDEVYLTNYKGNSNNVTVPESIDDKQVVSIGAIFQGRSIVSVVIPSGVKSIGSCAFEGCTYLTTVTFGDNSQLESIDSEAFYDCSALTSIEIPSSVTDIGTDAFYGCSGVESITVDSNNAIYKSDGNCLIDRSDNTLILGCKNSVIPNYVTSIGSRAFIKCSTLTNIEIPTSVISIGSNAFWGCSGLKSIEIPSSVTSIDSNVFNGSYYLIIYCEISSKPSGWSSNWKSSMIPVVWNYGGERGETEEGIKWALTNSNTITICRYSGTSTDVVIPNEINGHSVTSIGDSAFSYCSNLTSIEISSGVTSIGEYAFQYCKSLTSIEIPSSATSIGKEAFRGCSSLTIYCEAESEPSGWSSDWNYDNRPVVWGYKKSE